MTASDLKKNNAPLRTASFASLTLLFFPPLLFAACLVSVSGSPRFDWVTSLTRWPWQLWGLLFSGTIATAGGVADWWFHKVWVTVGPNEHTSHLYAMAGGGLEFLLMAGASVSARPQAWLVPVLVTLIATVVLISYDEFVFHRRRCTEYESRMHHMLTFGNGCAFLCWFHWLFA